MIVASAAIAAVAVKARDPLRMRLAHSSETIAAEQGARAFLAHYALVDHTKLSGGEVINLASYLDDAFGWHERCMQLQQTVADLRAEMTRQ